MILMLHVPGRDDTCPQNYRNKEEFQHQHALKYNIFRVVLLHFYFPELLSKCLSLTGMVDSPASKLNS